MKKHHKTRNIISIDPAHFELSQLKIFAYLIPISLLMVLPIIFILCNAFKPTEELFAYPPRFYVIHPTLNSFRRLFHFTSNMSVPVSRYLFNNILYTGLTMLLTVGMTLCTAYCLSKKRFLLKKYVLVANDIALMFVPVAVGIPRYFVIVNLHLVDNFLVQILPLLAMPVGLFLVKQFMDQIPDALIESASIDGASDFLIVRKIVLPIVSPALATVALLSFQSSWGAVEASSLYINNDALKTFGFYMTVLTSASSGNTVAGQGMAAAAALIMFIPNLVLFIILQSRVMNTMAHSGIK